MNQSSVQTKYTKRSLFDILLKGTNLESAFEVEGHSRMSISNFREIIYKQKKNNFKIKGFDANKLCLWEVDIPGDTENVKLKTLQSSSRDIDKEEITIQELGGKKLTPFSDFGDIFKCDSKNIRIIAQPPATTDQGRFRGTENLEYVPRREGNLGGTLLLYDQLTSNGYEGISLSDKDTYKRTEVVKSLINELLDKRIILVRSPPNSGKTALTQLIEDYLVNSSEYSNYRVIRFSALWGSDVGKVCNWNDFGEAWEKILGVNWVKWRGECSKIKSILIIDEVQKMYRKSYQHGENDNTAAQFWESVKGILQGSHGIYIIMFGAYGYGFALGNLSSPVEIPLPNCKSIFDIRFTDHELEEYVTTFCRCFNLKEDNKNIVPEFIRYIKNATVGHVGFVSHILNHTREQLKSKVNNLTWNDILTYLNSNGFNETINNRRGLPKIESFTDKQILLCENVLLTEGCSYQSDDPNIVALVKSGVLVIDNYTLQFSAPIVMRSFIYQKYGKDNTAVSPPTSLYKFIIDVFSAICIESQDLLKKSLGYGKDELILEQMWQKEFYRIGKRLLNGYFMSCDVGATFASNGYVDFYVDRLNWAIEILREGRDMAKHAKKFGASGIYNEITLKAESYAIIDIRTKLRKVQKLKENFVHVSYSESYDSFKIECLGKKTRCIKFKV